MRWSIANGALLLASVANAASSWTFADASVTVASKTADDITQTFSEKDRAKTAVVLGHTETLKIALTTKEGSKAKRPHQAFLLLKEKSGLEAPFPLDIKSSGKATVDLTQKDLPIQLLQSTSPLEAKIVVGSFGSSQASLVSVFDLDVKLDPNVPPTPYEAPLRYGKKPLISHIFRDDPKSPPQVVSLAFVLAVLATIPALFIGWALLGGNVFDAQKAMSSAPVSHAAFFGSIIAMEGVFFLYYSSWNLFQTLPVAGVVSVVAFLSGTRALGEVQRRRLAGQR